jgi:hypothetical protein
MNFAAALLPWVFFAAAPATPPDTGIAALNQSSFPVFTKEGYRSLLLRASETEVVSTERIELTGMNLTAFSGDAAERVESILLAPAATFLRAEDVVRGEKSVRFIRDDFEASGTRWIYHHREKSISIDGNVRVVFQAELKDILK